MVLFSVFSVPLWHHSPISATNNKGSWFSNCPSGTMAMDSLSWSRANHCMLLLGYQAHSTTTTHIRTVRLSYATYTLVVPITIGVCSAPAIVVGARAWLYNRSAGITGRTTRLPFALRTRARLDSALFHTATSPHIASAEYAARCEGKAREQPQKCPLFTTSAMHKNTTKLCVDKAWKKLQMCKILLVHKGIKTTGATRTGCPFFAPPYPLLGSAFSILPR